MKLRNPEQIAKFLAGTPVFSVARQTILNDIAQSAACKSVGQGQVLFTQMDTADHVYVVVSGCISLFLATEDGKELVINEMQRGDCFGELSLITHEPRSTGAIAQEASEVVIIPSHTFMKVLQSDTVLMQRVLETTASRLRKSSERESALAFLDANARIARILLDLDQKESDKGFIRITQESLGQYVGLTRQTVARTLGAWRREGWVLTARGGIRILDRTKLEEQACETQIGDR
ncbi:MAG: Crp/Fnr family transcriptional regulator [Anaerolineales bacterium]|jgi:CRP-like cAMP-binding protein